jgi:hypothetical protein
MKDRNAIAKSHHPIINRGDMLIVTLFFALVRTQSRGLILKKGKEQVQIKTVQCPCCLYSLLY